MDTIDGMIARLLGTAKTHEAGPGPRRRFFEKKKQPRRRYIVKVDAECVWPRRAQRRAGRIASANPRGRLAKRWTVKAWAARTAYRLRAA